MPGRPARARTQVQQQAGTSPSGPHRTA